MRVQLRVKGRRHSDALVAFTPETELRLKSLAERSEEPLPSGLEDAIRASLMALGESPQAGASVAELLVQLSAKVAGLPDDASSDVITTARSLCALTNL